MELINYPSGWFVVTMIFLSIIGACSAFATLILTVCTEWIRALITGALTVLCISTLISLAYTKTSEEVYSIAPVVFDFKSNLVFVDTINFQSYTAYNQNIVTICRTEPCNLVYINEKNKFGLTWNSMIVVKPK